MSPVEGKNLSRINEKAIFTTHFDIPLIRNSNIADFPAAKKQFSKHPTTVDSESYKNTHKPLTSRRSRNEPHHEAVRAHQKAAVRGGDPALEGHPFRPHRREAVQHQPRWRCLHRRPCRPNEEEDSGEIKYL